MWISKKELHARCLAEYHTGLRIGIGIGRNQILCRLVARKERLKHAATLEMVVKEAPEPQDHDR